MAMIVSIANENMSNDVPMYKISTATMPTEMSPVSLEMSFNPEKNLFKILVTPKKHLQKSLWILWRR